MNIIIAIPLDVLSTIVDDYILYELRNTSTTMKMIVDTILSSRYANFSAKIQPLKYQLKVEYSSRFKCNATTARNMYKLKTAQLDILNYTHGRGNTRLYNVRDVILTSMEFFKDIQDLYAYQKNRQYKIEEKKKIQAEIQMKKIEHKFKQSISSIIHYHPTSKPPIQLRTPSCDMYSNINAI